MRPASAPGSGSAQPNRRRRTAGPIAAEAADDRDLERRRRSPSSTCAHTIDSIDPDRPVGLSQTLDNTIQDERTDDHAPRTDRHHPAPRARRSPSSRDFANAEQWDPGVATLRPDRTRVRSASAPATAWASGWAGGSSPMDYEVTAFEPQRRVVLEGRGRGIRAVDEIRFSGDRRRHPDRLHRRHPPRRPAAPRAPVRRRCARAASGASAREGMQRALDRRATGGLTSDGRRDRRLRDQRPHGRLALCGATTASPCSSATRDARRPRQDRRASDAPGGPVAVDTGFIVYNERTYPRFVGLLAELGVETQPSDMSFGCRCDACGIAFSSRGARGFFPDPRTAARPGPVADAGRRPALLPRRTRRCSTARARPTSTLGRLAGRAALRTAVPRPLPRPDHVGRLVHRGGPDRGVPCRLPAPLPRQPRPDRRRATRRSGASSAAARAPTSSASSPRCRAGTVRTGAPVARVRARPVRRDDRDRGTGAERFDAVVLATHADDALRLLGDAGPRERRVLGGFEYSHERRRAPHRRRASCPPNPRARASWNVATADCRRPGDALTMTYHMNRLQSLPGAVDYCVSLNPGDAVRPERVIVERACSATRCTRSARSTRSAGSRRSRVGAGPGSPARISGYGFHEDGCRSGFEAADDDPRRRSREVGGMRSHLLEGKVRHRRSRPFTYGLEHDVWYAALDLAELDELDTPAAAVRSQPPGRDRVPRPRPPAGRRDRRRR